MDKEKYVISLKIVNLSFNTIIPGSFRLVKASQKLAS